MLTIAHTDRIEEGKPTHLQLCHADALARQMLLSHGTIPHISWGEILDKIKLSSNLKEFREKYNSEYNAARRNPEWKKILYQMLPSNKKSSNIY